MFKKKLMNHIEKRADQEKEMLQRISKLPKEEQEKIDKSTSHQRLQQTLDLNRGVK